MTDGGLVDKLLGIRFTWGDGHFLYSIGKYGEAMRRMMIRMKI